MTLKKITYFAFSLLLSYPTISLSHVLKSPSIQFIDGGLVNGESFKMLRWYQFQLRKILIGTRQKNNQQLVGTYEYDGQMYSAAALAKIESQIDSETRNVLLDTMRNDFKVISERFLQIIKSVKGAIKTLIIESNTMRNRSGNLLEKWLDPSVTDEVKLFNTEIRTIHDFNEFLTDLHNFIQDLVDSCPKGHQLYLELLKSA